jgi:phospholipase C
MLENRSFDNIAGYWTFNKKLDNLVNNPHCNTYYSANYTVWGQPYYICSQPYEQEVPLHDPDHAFGGTNYEIFETFTPDSNMTPTMGGFVQREQQVYNSTPGDASFVIQGFSQEKTNVLATLAENYAVFDRYVSGKPTMLSPSKDPLGSQ